MAHADNARLLMLVDRFNRNRLGPFREVLSEETFAAAVDFFIDDFDSQFGCEVSPECD